MNTSKILQNALSVLTCESRPHCFVESLEMKDVYGGVVVGDADGQATVEVPVWLRH